MVKQGENKSWVKGSMAKTYQNLYMRLWQPENLWVAWKQASRGKRSHAEVAHFEYHLEEELLALEEELREKRYQPGAYRNFVIQCPKRRLISAAPFRDRVVHHALMNVIEPLFERRFIFDSYANRRGKGTHRALDRCTYYLRRHNYVMHVDVVQFFPAIDHQILRSILARIIWDEDVLWLIDKILESGARVHQDEYHMVYFPGDDLFAVHRPRGLPIGNLTSQFWANVYLNELDQYVKRVLKCRAYLRYVDDILLFAQRKQDLHHYKSAIEDFLARLRLTIHTESAQPRPVASGVPFLGFIIYPNHRRLKKRNGIQYARRLRLLVKKYRSGEIEKEKLLMSLRGWLHHASHGDTWGLRKAVLASVGLLERAYAG